MYNQLGGNVIWDSNSWKAKPGQEYSVMEKDLLTMLKVEPAEPIRDKIVKSGQNKGRVKKLSSWWENPLQKEPMTKSLYDIISGVDGYSIPEISLQLQEIIDRRTQDADKLETISTSKLIKGHHINYLESLKKAKEFTEAAFIDFIKHKHNTQHDSISPYKINFTDTKEVATRLSHDAPVFVPTTTPDTCLQEPLYPQPLYSQPLYNQPLYPQHVYPLQQGVGPNTSPIILQYNPAINRFYTFNTLTNEIVYID